MEIRNREEKKAREEEQRRKDKEAEEQQRMIEIMERLQREDAERQKQFEAPPPPPDTARVDSPEVVIEASLETRKDDPLIPPSTSRDSELEDALDNLWSEWGVVLVGVNIIVGNYSNIIPPHLYLFVLYYDLSIICMGVHQALQTAAVYAPQRKVLRR